jgi:hypothetical protein
VPPLVGGKHRSEEARGARHIVIWECSRVNRYRAAPGSKRRRRPEVLRPLRTEMASDPFLARCPPNQVPATLFFADGWG